MGWGPFPCRNVLNYFWKRPAWDRCLPFGMKELHELAGGSGGRKSCCQEEGFVGSRVPGKKGMRKQSLQWGLKVLVWKRYTSLPGHRRR